jgi:hypothetical protein
MKMRDSQPGLVHSTRVTESLDFKFKFKLLGQTT